VFDHPRGGHSLAAPSAATSKTLPSRALGPEGWATSVSRPELEAPRLQGLTEAERAGFEPAMEFDPHTRLAGECLQPLGHLSWNRDCQCRACRELPADDLARALGDRFDPRRLMRSGLAMIEVVGGEGRARSIWSPEGWQSG
jgi:hypothetical protein